MKKEKRTIDGEEVNVLVHEPEDCAKGKHCAGCLYEFHAIGKVPDPATKCCVCGFDFTLDPTLTM